MAMTKAQKAAQLAKHQLMPVFGEGEETILDEDMGIEVTVPVERCVRCGRTTDEALSEDCVEGM